MPVARNVWLPISLRSLASQYKLTPETLDAWSQILMEVPDARMIVRNGELSSASCCEWLTDQFVSRGVAASRLQLFGRTSHYEFLKTYDQIDIALDPFPYSGGTTTMEALWQGVPVVTSRSNRWAGRTSETLLRASGMSDCIAESEECYAELAVRVAADEHFRSRYLDKRLSFRTELADSSASCRELTAALESAARRICGRD